MALSRAQGAEQTQQSALLISAQAQGRMRGMVTSAGRSDAATLAGIQPELRLEKRQRDKTTLGITSREGERGQLGPARDRDHPQNGNKARPFCPLHPHSTQQPAQLELALLRLLSFLTPVVRRTRRSMRIAQQGASGFSAAKANQSVRHPRAHSATPG